MKLKEWSIFPIVITLGVQLDNYLGYPHRRSAGYNYGVGKFIF